MRKDDYTPTERAVKLMDMYYHSMASTSMEWTYWYTRKFNEEEGELPLVRRAKALACAFEHDTPVIYPGELLVGAKTGYLRGTFPMPWLIQSFSYQRAVSFMANIKRTPWPATRWTPKRRSAWAAAT